MSDWLADIHAALASADPDAALAGLASAGAWLADLPSPPTPPAFVGLSMIAGALIRVGRGAAVRPFLGMAPDAYWPGRAFAPTRASLVGMHSVLWVPVLRAAIDAEDWLGAVDAVLAFEEATRTDPDGGHPTDADSAALIAHPAATSYGPFRFNRAWVLDLQSTVLQSGALDRRLEPVRDFEQIFVENALRSRQPERALPLVEGLREGYVSVGNTRGGHLEFNCICVLATLGRFEDALRRARGMMRHSDRLRWRFDLAAGERMPWTRAMGQAEWLGPLSQTQAYQTFVREEVEHTPFPVDDPAADAICAVRDDVLEGKSAKRCFLTRRLIKPGEPVVRMRRLSAHNPDESFVIVAQHAFVASGWAEARRQFHADQVPLAALFPEPRWLLRRWESPSVAAFHHDLARGAGLDLDRAARLIAEHAPGPVRLTWLTGRYRFARLSDPVTGDTGHGDPVNFLWRLLKAGHAAALFERTAQQAQADQVFAMVATFARDDCRAAAAAHFGLPGLPAMMDRAFAERLSLDDHLALAAFGQDNPRWRSGLVAAMRAYALHLYSNGHPGVDWFLAGLEHYRLARCCNLLFFLVHHPEDDPVFSEMLARFWLPNGVSTGGFDAYGNGLPFYYRAAVLNRALHAPEELPAWLESDWMAFYCGSGKDRDTRRMVARLSRKAASI
jgi:hypothetical protein